jgi:RNA polymerase sigma-70 factor (ECF subfamily)
MHHPTADPELLKRCMKRDRRAQNEFHRQHFAYLMHVALGYTNSRDQAAEWVNSAFVKVFLNLKAYDTSRHLGTWMGSVLRNVIIDDLRKQARVLSRHDDVDVERAGRGLQDVDPHAFPELMELVGKELDTLSETTKRVFVMYVVEGYNHREISEQLAIAEGTSRWHFSQARHALRELLTSNWMRHGL